MHNVPRWLRLEEKQDFFGEISTSDSLVFSFQMSTIISAKLGNLVLGLFVETRVKADANRNELGMARR